MNIEAIAAGALLAGTFSLFLNWRHNAAASREIARLSADVAQHREQCSQQLSQAEARITTFMRDAQETLESLRDGELGLPSRSRALRLLRTGVSADAAAVELGLGRSDLRLLEKVAASLR